MSYPWSMSLYGNYQHHARDSRTFGIIFPLAENKRDRECLAPEVFVKNSGELWILFRLRDVLISQKVYLQAMLDYMDRGGKSRGSALYTDKPESEFTFEMFREFSCEAEKGETLIQEISLEGEGTVCRWRPVRPIPKDDDFFENVWRGYRENGNVY